VRAHAAAKVAGFKVLIGAEITPEDAPPVLLYAPDRAAYGRLARLITRGRRAAEKGECHLTFADVAEHADDLLAAVVPVSAGGPSPKRERGASLAHASGSDGTAPEHLTPYRDVFADR